MPAQSRRPATNERIVTLLEELRAELARASEQPEQIARELARLMRRSWSRRESRRLGWLGGRVVRRRIAAQPRCARAL
jgi:hypothetical protein